MAKRIGPGGNPVPSTQNYDISVHLVHPQKGVDTVVFPDGLEGITLTYPERQTTTQALNGVWIDSLGFGIRTITISGHTGWTVKETGLDGADVFSRITNIHRTHVQRVAGNPADKGNLILVNDPGSKITVRCLAKRFQVVRDKSRPLLFQFTWEMDVIEGPLPRPDSLHLSQPPVRDQEATALRPGHRRSRAYSAQNQRGALAAHTPMGGTTYIVQSGDTLSGIIAAAYHPTSTDQSTAYMDAVLRHPQNLYIHNANLIAVGSKIYLPRRIAL